MQCQQEVLNNFNLVINEWFDGKTVYKKRKQHNERIGKAVLEYIFKKFAPEIYNKDPKGYL